MYPWISAVFLMVLCASQHAAAQSNIDPVNCYAWTENLGWINWRAEAVPDQGVVVHGTFLSGFAWAENVGWINFGDGTPVGGTFYSLADGTDAGVNVAPDGSLFGYAWGENVGWINFDGGILAVPPDPARIECDGRFKGFAWGENFGWINLSELSPGKFVAVEASFAPLACDMNHDGAVDGQDIGDFLRLMFTAQTPGWNDVCSGDVEATPDQAIGPGDIDAFVACLLGSA